jgi:hypothetical protein
MQLRGVVAVCGVGLMGHDEVCTTRIMNMIVRVVPLDAKSIIRLMFFITDVLTSISISSIY